MSGPGTSVRVAGVSLALAATLAAAGLAEEEPAGRPTAADVTFVVVKVRRLLRGK